MMNTSACPCDVKLSEPNTDKPLKYPEINPVPFAFTTMELPSSTPIPPAFFTVPKSTSPVLLLSGGIDPVTPTKNGAQVALALGEKARHISIDNAGHGLLSHGCVREVMANFVAAKTDAEALKVNAECVRQIPRPLAWIAPKTVKFAGESK